MYKQILIVTTILVTGCASQPEPQEPQIIYIPVERLELSQRLVKPTQETVRMYSSVEHVAVSNSLESPREIKSLNLSSAKWTVKGKPVTKPEMTEAIAGEGIRNGLLRNIYFAPGSAEFDDDTYIKELSFKLKSIGGEVSVYGYYAGSERDDDLAISRARAVAKKLIDAGVFESRINAQSGGVTHLYADDSQNRRVSIFLRIE